MMQKEGDVNVDALKQTVEQVRSPEETDFSRDGSAESSLGKRKMAEREPESPGQHNPLELDPVTPYTNKKERAYYDEMEQDSPASYPKHVMVPADRPQDEQKRSEQQKEIHPDYAVKMGQTGPPLLTPDSLAQRRQNSFDAPLSSRDQPYHHHHHDMYRAPSYHDVDYVRNTFGEPEQTRPPVEEGGSSRHRRWACDFCNVATFLSYEEACAHEEACARHHAAREDRHHHNLSSVFGQPPQGHPQALPPHQPGTGLGALYHASQEVVTPPTPHRSHHSTSTNRWGTRGPPLPVLPHEHGYYRQGYYDQREDPAYYGRYEQHYAPPPPPPQYAYGYPQHPPAYGHHSSPPPPPVDRHQKRMLLAMPTDTDSLSDRQCYVRAEMCEIFAATDKDVAARHSKGAQKLVIGQVGIRCIHCAHLRPRDRAERAVCYPSSISRIYQTVADMQRFHFEQCSQIPKRVCDIYKTLKTTRPRGVGSPQAYWVQSAKSLGLVDTEGGIRFDMDLAKQQNYQSKAKDQVSASDMSIEANKSTQS